MARVKRLLQNIFYLFFEKLGNLGYTYSMDNAKETLLPLYAQLHREVRGFADSGETLTGAEMRAAIQEMLRVQYFAKFSEH